MPKKFQKRVEDFICNHCGQEVQGTGYTNHCPACLWSKHVDVNPGDRAAKCGGLMPPVGLFLRLSNKVIIHRCSKCSHEKLNEAVPQDNADELIKLSSLPVSVKK